MVIRCQCLWTCTLWTWGAENGHAQCPCAIGRNALNLEIHAITCLEEWPQSPGKYFLWGYSWWKVCSCKPLPSVSFTGKVSRWGYIWWPCQSYVFWNNETQTGFCTACYKIFQEWVEQSSKVWGVMGCSFTRTKVCIYNILSTMTA
jgi:hypothetical protein